jgi:hypothetical protein
LLVHLKVVALPKVLVHLKVLALPKVLVQLEVLALRMSMNTTKVKHFSVLLEPFRKFLRVFFIMPLLL